MVKQGSGWKGESRRHSLARKGVKTIDNMKADAISTSKLHDRYGNVQDSFREYPYTFRIFTLSDQRKEMLKELENELFLNTKEMFTKAKDFYMFSKEQIISKYHQRYMAIQNEIMPEMDNAIANKDNSKISELSSKLAYFEETIEKDVENDLKTLANNFRIYSDRLRKIHETKHEHIVLKYDAKLKRLDRKIDKDDVDELYGDASIKLINISTKIDQNHRNAMSFIKNPERLDEASIMFYDYIENIKAGDLDG